MKSDDTFQPKQISVRQWFRMLKIAPRNVLDTIDEEWKAMQREVIRRDQEKEEGDDKV